MKTAAASMLAAFMLGLLTYEAITLAIAASALAVAIVALIQGADTRRDLKVLLDKQNTRAGRLVEELERDVHGENED